MIDTHSHIYLEEFDVDRDDCIKRAKDSGVTHLVLPNVDMNSYAQMVDTHNRYPDFTSMAMGLHPTSVGENWEKQIALTLSCLDEYPFVAIGEVGIDLYWDTTFKEAQMKAFDAQMRWASERNMPVIIHCREALNEVLEVFSNFGRQLPECVFHSFSGSLDDVKRIRNFGDFFFGFNGVVTFKNAHLEDVIKYIGENNILLETDCPYLTPVPHRGKRNASAYVAYVAEKISSVLNVSVKHIKQVTDNNAVNFFRLPQNVTCTPVR